MPSPAKPGQRKAAAAPIKKAAKPFAGNVAKKRVADYNAMMRQKFGPAYATPSARAGVSSPVAPRNLQKGAGYGLGASFNGMVRGGIGNAILKATQGSKSSPNRAPKPAKPRGPSGLKSARRAPKARAR